MKAADRSGASHVVVVGDRDLAEGVGQLKDMRTGEQRAVPVGELFETPSGEREGSEGMETAAARADRGRRRVVGLGTWQLGGDWGDVDDDTAPEVLDAALDAGVTLLDTADVYGDGRSEERIRKALAPRSDRPFVATKAGRRADPFEAAQYTPENLRAWIDRSRRNLGVETLDLVQLHAHRRRSTRTSGCTTRWTRWSTRRRSPRTGCRWRRSRRGWPRWSTRGCETVHAHEDDLDGLHPRVLQRGHALCRRCWPTP